MRRSEVLCILTFLSGIEKYLEKEGSRKKPKTSKQGAGGEKMSEGGQPAKRSCGSQECAQIEHFPVQFTVSSALPFSLSDSRGNFEIVKLAFV